MIRPKVRPLALLALAALLSAGFWACDKHKEQGPDVLVSVYGDPIKVEDMERAWLSLTPQQRQDYLGVEGVNKLLDEMVTLKEMAHEAKVRRLDQTPEFKKKMKLYRQQMLVNALLDTAVTDADVFKKFQANFVRAKVIKTGFPADATEAQKKAALEKAEKAAAELKEGKDFGEVAAEYSDDSSAGHGGEMGYVNHEVVETHAGFKPAQILFSLEKPGDVSEPVEGKDGYYIFELVEERGKLNPQGLNKDLSDALASGMRQESIRSFANELKSRRGDNVVYNQQAMDDFFEDVRTQLQQADGQDKTNSMAGSTVQPGATAAAPQTGSTATLAPE